MTGIQILKQAYSTREKLTNDRYQGYHVYKSQKEIVGRFESGKPLSCFVLKGNLDVVHVAYKCGEGRKNGLGKGRGTIAYLTFGYSTHLLHTQETGVHFCEFHHKETTELPISPKDLKSQITDYALMLPYWKMSGNDKLYLSQFTLVYSDWEVLRCDLPVDKKGFATTNNNLFGEV